MLGTCIRDVYVCGTHMGSLTVMEIMPDAQGRQDTETNFVLRGAPKPQWWRSSFIFEEVPPENVVGFQEEKIRVLSERRRHALTDGPRGA
jgi:hypothetical protein